MGIPSSIEKSKGFISSNILYIIIGVLILFMLFIINYYRTKELNTIINGVKEQNKVLVDKVKRVETAFDSIQIIKQKALIKKDSFEIRETYFKNKYYATNNKLKKILTTYDNSSDDDKWAAFSRSLRE
jgi:hypothetical protein